ncbi:MULTISPECIES: SAM-dependent methyltransferase [Streptosporangium]|uniref:27-O-demethylrifamycin SV methyltransferase n=1 Tax=Streptosporangium brasiliense TaxID=47480 RepID=A0ABT9RE46_9ACTN|nr:class I SAM-dependent methyltransferase [Streptosporangium brasiliense]MDP9867527.1 27-O-demethylrifamycin SV methyltransferase [Streptosporangium brasiliense]
MSSRSLPRIEDVSSSYEYLAALTEKVGGPDLHYGYWSGPEDRSSIEEATARLTRVVIERLRAGVGEHVLDVGCGNGRPAVAVAETTGARVTAIDVNEHALERGRAWARERGVGSSVSFERCDALAMPYPEASFDAALILESTPHFMPEPLFAEVARVLRPGGRVVVETPCLRVPLTEEMRSRLTTYFEMFQVLSIEPEEVYVEALCATGFELEAVADLTEHTEPFYGRVLERLDRHRDGLTAEYGAEAVERVESGILNCTEISGMGSILITGSTSVLRSP